jgi:hypothetical protein
VSTPEAPGDERRERSWAAVLLGRGEFLLQWDDELVPREAGLALFDAFASREKTLHANPGRHTEVPAFELESSARFFTRHSVEGQAQPVRTR